MDNPPKGARGVSVSFQNIIRLMSLLTVTIIVSFLVLLSCFHGDWKALFLIIGIGMFYFLMATPTVGIQAVLTRMFGIVDSGMGDCKGVEMGIFSQEYPFPSLSTGVMGFINSALLFPMLSMKWQNENIGLIVGLFTLTALMFFTRYQNKCDGGSMMSLVFGLIFGLVIGVFYYLVINAINPELGYHGHFVNNSRCSSKSRRFVCEKK